MVGSEYLLHYHGAVRKASGSAIIRGRARRGVGHVHLVALRIDHCIRSEQFVTVSIVGRFADVPVLVDQLKPVKVLRALGIGSLISGQNNYRENENDKPDSTRHLLVLSLLYRGAVGSVWRDGATLLKGWTERC